MKKLVLSLAILGFVTFSALSIQNLMASASQNEMVNYDKDPKKDDNKKAANTKEIKAEGTSEAAEGKSAKSGCATSCDDKAGSAHSCCSGDKASSTSSVSPDKK